MKSRNVITLILIVVICTGLTIVGCSDNKGDILKQVSGQWQDTQDNSQVKIQLTGDSKSITVKGQTYPVTVDSVEPMNYVVSLKVQNGSAQPESWKLQQIWNEGGDGFKLAFFRNGQKDMLVSGNQSS